MTDRLVVDHHHCRYRVNRGHPDPAGVRRKLDGVVAERVPARLAEALASSLPSGDGVVVIRSLGLRIVVGAAEPELLATTDLWTKGLASAILRAIAGDGANVARFPSRAAYVGSFVAAIGRGDVWSEWVFDQFRAWRPLGPGGALLAACEAYPGLIAAALSEAATERGGGLIDAITMLSTVQADRVAVLAGVPPASSIGRPSIGRRALPPTLVAALRSGRSLAGSPSHLAIWMLAHTAGEPDGEGATSSAADGATVAALAVWGPELLSLGLLDASPPRGPSTGAAGTGAPGLRWARVVAALPGLMAQLPAFGTRPADREAAAGQEPLSTAFGGCILLLAGLADLDLDALLVQVGIDPAAAGPLAGRLRWSAMLAALGREHRLRARFDPVLLRLAGDPGGAFGRALVTTLLPGRTCAEVARRLPALDPATTSADEAHLDATDLADDAAVAALVTRIGAHASRDAARRLPGFATSSASYTATNLLVGAALVRFEPGGAAATLPDVPLRVALQMAGWDDRVIAAPWLPGGELRVTRDPS